MEAHRVLRPARGRKTNLLSPLLSTKAKLGIDVVWSFVHLVSRTATFEYMREALKVKKNTLTRLWRLLLRPCAAWAEAARLNAVHGQVDECHIGSRKHHRGKRVRTTTCWFYTFTTDSETIWELATEGRTREASEAFIAKHIASSKSVVYTDRHKSYLHVGNREPPRRIRGRGRHAH